MQQEAALEGLRQFIKEHMFYCICDYALIKNQCLAEIDSQAEPDRKGELNEVLEQVSGNLKNIIGKLCKYRAVNYYSPAKMGG